MNLKELYIAPAVEELVLSQGLNILLDASGELQDSVEEGDSGTFGDITYSY